MAWLEHVSNVIVSSNGGMSLRNHAPYHFFVFPFLIIAISMMTSCLGNPDDALVSEYTQAIGETVVYAEDFEHGAGPEWGITSTNNAHPATLTRFSGRFANNTQTLSLALLSGDYELRFDFYVLDTWDGGGPGCVTQWTGPDRFQVTVGGVIEFDETFSRWSRSACQSYRPLAPLENLGGSASTSDSRYRLTIPFSRAGGATVLRFRGVGLQGVADESWGIDNVAIVKLVRDSDGDGVLDEDDECPDTAPGSVVDASGCSIADLCPCDDRWRNHGAYVSCVAHTANDFLDQWLISSEEHGDIVSGAARSDCGRPEAKRRMMP